MEIFGIGIDIIEVERVRKAIERHKNFLTRIYTEEEIKLSLRGEFRYEELAGRFAVKEAVMKALKTGLGWGIAFKDIVVLNEPGGAPYVVLNNKAKEYAEGMKIKKIFVSISHIESLAIGLAVAIT